MKMSDQAEEDAAVQEFRELSNFPVIKNGQICNKDTPGHIQVTSNWSQRDLKRKENVTYNKSYMIQLDVVVSTPPQEIAKEEWNVESPSGTKRVVIRKVVSKSGEDQQYIEVWNDSLKISSFSVEFLDQHGKIYEDGVFGCLQWSHAETHVVYVAEKKRPKAKSYFDKKPTSAEEKDKESGKGEEYVYTDDWGEQMVGKSQSVLCVLDIEDGAVSVLDNLPEDVSPGSAVWCPADLGILCVGTYQESYRLGRIYCPIRRSALFHIDLKTYKCDILGSKEFAVQTPVFSPDGTKLVYLESNAGGPHCQCSRLKMCDWSTKGILTVKDIPRGKKEIEAFPGLHVHGLNARCFDKDSRRILAECQWRSRKDLIIVDCETGDVTRLTSHASDSSVGCWTLLDFHNDIVMASCSSPSRPEYLVLGHLPARGKESTISWAPLSTVNTLPEISWSVHNMWITPERVNKQFDFLDYEYIVIEPTHKDPNKKLPLWVFPHGGPHSVFSPGFMLYPAAICRLGFMVVCVNYRGSFGFGQDSIESLPGNIGSQDVEDCQAVAAQVLKTRHVDPAKVVVMGGSHGGFLTAHLIGQYPDFYKAAVARNPVINIASMQGATDIPDWCFVEAGYSNYHQGSIGDPDFYTKAWEKSPIRYVDQVKTPVLLCIGLKDRRVPPQQGNEYRKALASRGVPVRMLTYPEDKHPIISVPAESDCFVNIYKWFMEHIEG